jgi:hypothetical protein
MGRWGVPARELIHGERVTEGMCPVCRTWGDLTVEHSLGWWIAKEYRDQAPWDIAGEGGLSYPKIVSEVCMRCNRRMGRHIEEPAKLGVVHSLVFDIPATSQTITGTQAKIIARWAIKQMVFVTYSYFKKPVPTVFWEWLNMPGRPLPPDGTSVWIGHFVPDAPAASPSEMRALEPQVRWGAKWASSFYLSHLAVFFLYEQTDGAPLAKHPAVDTGHLVKLDWNRRSSVEWPPVWEIGVDL